MRDKHQICEQFLSDYNISRELALQEATAIYCIRLAKLEISALEFLIMGKPVEAQILWVILVQLINYAESSLVSFITGSPKSANVISRTVTELSISLAYILEEDQKSRLIQYLSHPVIKERERLEKLRKDMQQFPTTYFDNQLRTLELLDIWISTLITKMGVTKPKKGWPDIFTLYQGAGYELHYRTDYATKSYIAHGSSVQLLTILAFSDFAAASNDGDLIQTILASQIQTEHKILYSGLLYCLETACNFSNHFDFAKDMPEIFQCRDAIDQLGSSMALVCEKSTQNLRD